MCVYVVCMLIVLVLRLKAFVWLCDLSGTHLRFVMPYGLKHELHQWKCCSFFLSPLGICLFWSI